MNATIGIWPSRNRLVVIELCGASDAHGRAIAVARTDAARRRLALHARSVYAEVVLTDALREQDPIGALLALHEVPLWVVPEGFVAAIIRAAKRRVRGPRAHAAILARLVLEPALHGQLRRLPPRPDGRQLRML